MKNKMISIILIISFSLLLTGCGNKEVKRVKRDEINKMTKLGGSYRLYKNKIYCGDIEVQNVDINTFEVLNDSNYAKDKTHVYYAEENNDGNNNITCAGTTVLPNVDIETFKVIDKPLSIAKDKNNIYCVDPFARPYDGCQYASYCSFNEGNVWVGIGCPFISCSNFAIKDADPVTFEIIDDLYRKDKDHIYCGCTKLELDPTAFQKLKSYYTKDNKNVYYFNKKLIDADPASFVSHDNGYGKDKNSAYYKNSRLEEIDLKTFYVFENISFQQDSPAYAKDKNNVYIDGYINTGADPKTFQP